MASKEFTDVTSSTTENSCIGLSKSDYAKVIFCDLVYHDPLSSVGCRFQITDDVHEDPSDYVGLFRVGYDNLSQCLVSKLLSETECEEDGKLLRCTFKTSELPELDNGFYQFLYVTRDNEVCGASGPFPIKHPMTEVDFSSDEDVVADKTEDDFLVVRSTSNLAEKSRHLQSDLDAMHMKNLALEEDLVKVKAKVNKVNEEKCKLEEEIERVSTQRDHYKKECKNFMNKISGLSNAKKEIFVKSENEKAHLSSQIKELKEKLIVQVEFVNERNKLQETMVQLKGQLLLKEATMNMMSKAAKLGEDEIEKRHSKTLDEVSSLASQLEDSKLMVSALEESKLLVMNEVTKLTEANSELKETVKNMRCENLALKLKLEDWESICGKYKKTNTDLKSEVTALKLHLVETQQLRPSGSNNTEGSSPSERVKTAHRKKSHAIEMCSKEQSGDTGTSPEKLDEHKIINQDCAHHRKKYKAHCDKLHSTLEEKNAIISKLKEECLKKDAVVEYLSKEKDNIQKTHSNLEEAMSDSILRLKEAAEIYKKQFMEIEKLKKKMEKLKEKSSRRESHSSESSTVKDISPSAMKLNDKTIVGAELPVNRSSDSDTGEHVVGAGTSLRLLSDMAAAALQEKNRQSSTHLDVATAESMDKLSSHGKFKDLFGQSLDITYLAVADGREPPLSPKKESPKLQSLIEENLAKLCCPNLMKRYFNTKNESDQELPWELSDQEFLSNEDETMYSIPCPVCDADIGIFASNSQEMIKHLEVQHKQQMCPVCGKLYDMTLPCKYFEFHVEDHFMNGKEKE